MLARFMSEIRRRRVLNVVTPYLIAAWLIIQIVVTTSPALALPDWVATLIVVASIVGFPIVLYVAWFFELTPEGIKRTPSLADGAVVKPLGVAHWIGLVATAGFAVAAGFVSVDVIGSRSSAPTEQASAVPDNKSVAVMPFEDLSPTQDLGYLAYGLAEEITVALGKLGQIRISAPSSAFRAAEGGDSITAVAEKLGVGAILMGSVRRAGDQLRVTASLVNAADGLTIWTDAFSRSMDDAVLVEEQIARSILGIMLERFLVDEETALLDRPNASDAHEFYLRGREAMRERTTESLREARTFFEQTIAADAEYAPGYAGLAAVLLLLSEGEQNFGTIDMKVATELARSNVDKALQRKPDLAEAHAVAGRISSLRGDTEAALASFDKAIEINPSYADAYLWRSNLLLKERRLDEASAALDKAFELDPLSPVVLYNKGFHRVLRGQFGEARDYYNALLDLEPGSPLAYRGLADAARRSGDVAASARTWKKAIEFSPQSTQYRDNLVGSLLTLGMGEAARLFASEDFETNLRIADGDFEGALEKVRFDFAASPDDPWMAFEAGWTELLYGEKARAFDALIQADSELSDADRFGMPYCSPAIEAAFAYQQRGDQPAADTRLAECADRLANERAQGSRSTELDYLGARLAQMRGETDEAARLLRQAYDQGWREPWTPYDPLILDPETGEPAPKIATTLDAIMSSLEAQRAELSKDAASWTAPG